MSKHANLLKAKNVKNDEFYTRLEDIVKELNSYDPKVFKNKVVFCNCDDPASSNFWNFFHMNFNRLGLKKLISTHYNMDGSPSYKMEYASKGLKDDVVLAKGIKKPLKGSGDFRSDECIKLLIKLGNSLGILFCLLFKLAYFSLQLFTGHSVPPIK